MKKFLIVFSFIISLILCVQSAKAETIKFIQVTDAHLTIQSEYSQKVLESAIDDINKQTNISFVVFTGDNIDTADEENLKRFVSIVKRLKFPYYVVLGNHDVFKTRGLSKTRYFEILRKENPMRLQNSANYKFSKGNFVFLTVDGAKEVIPGPAGYFRQNTLAWVDKTLSKNKNKTVIIFQHFPLEYPESSPGRLKTHKTYKAEEYKEMLDKHNNVLAILSGHFHVNGEVMKNGVYHISTPSLLSVPNSYKIIDIVTTPEFSPIIYTQLREFEVNVK